VSGRQDLRIEGALITSDGSINLESLAGNVTVVDSASVWSQGGAIRIWAKDDARIAAIQAAPGSVSVTAETGSILSYAQTDRVVISAELLRLVAGTGIGDDNALHVQANLVSALAGNGDISLIDEDGLVIDEVGGTVAPIIIHRLLPDGTLVTQAEPLLKGLFAQNGQVRVEVFNGDILVRKEVKTGGDGHILLQTQGGKVHRQAVVEAGGNTVIVEGMGLSLSWPVIEGALAYRLEIQRDGVFYDNPWIPKGNSWTSASLPSGRIEMVVTPYMAQGYGTPGEPVVFTIEKRIALQVPADAVENQPVTFAWTAQVGASAYQVRISQAGQLIGEHWVFGETRFTPDYLLAKGTYQWAVLPWGPQGFGLMSATASFVVAAVDVHPTSVPENVPLYKQPLVLDWTPMEKVQWYRVQIQHENKTVLSQWVTSGAATGWIADAILPWGTSHWSVDAWTFQGMTSVFGEDSYLSPFSNS
jgi:hypothetical protein